MPLPASKQPPDAVVRTPPATPLKWHGGKHYLAGKLIALMPPHVHYVEPFAGGLAVMLAKDPNGVSEVANDLDGLLTNFWDVLRCETRFGELARLAEATPFSEELFGRSAEVLNGVRRDGLYDRVGAAHAFLVRCRQSLAGRGKAFAPLSRARTRRGMNEQASAWLTAVEGLPAVHARLKRVAILNRDAAAVIRSQDGPGTLFYCDPPYLPETRASPDVYRHEMTRDQHAALLAVLAGIKGRFLLSGYPNELNDAAAAAHGWRRRNFELPNNAAGGAAKRRMNECVWMNFMPETGTIQLSSQSAVK